MTSNTNAINFRTKFSKHIQCDEEHAVFVSAFEKFINLDAETATNMLWRLTYNPYSEALWTINLDPETISSEMTAALRNELRYQYTQHYSDFLAAEVPEECMDAYTLLTKRTDAIAAYVVYTHCNIFLYFDEASVTRVLFLLNSDKENQYFGGLRSLNFNMEESEFLKPSHMEIYTLLKAMYELRKSQGAYTSSSNPFQNLDTMIQQTGNDLPFTFGEEQADTVEKTLVEETQGECLPEEIPAEEPAQELVQNIALFNAITAENVLEHKDVFSAFAITRDMSCLVQLSKLGFDLNQVVAKETAITNFIQAAVALSV